MEPVSEIIKKFSPLNVALCKIQPVKDVFFGCSKINGNIDKYKEALENLATELSGVLAIDIVFLKNKLKTKDINNDGAQPSVSHGISKLVGKVRNFYLHHGFLPQNHYKFG